jgi:hypothetical protein
MGISMAKARYDLRGLRKKTGSATIQTLRGHDYLVISVVALVEGVRHAGGSDHPELVLAAAFGRVVDTWNGRPVVLNHPVDKNGNAVLASDPGILEDVYLGRLYHAAIVDDKKLVVEAWMDIDAIESSKNDDIVTMWGMLNSGETVEVSIGAVVFSRDLKGTYEGKKYNGVWDVVIPDHLAFLDGGQIGACSIADGCGTYRNANDGVAGSLRIAATGSVTLDKDTVVALNKRIRTTKSDTKVSLTEDTPPVTALASDCACHGDDDEVPTEMLRVADEANGLAVALWGKKTFSTDKYNLLNRALRKQFKAKYGYVLTFSDTEVVTQSYDYTNDDITMWAMSYKTDDDDQVTFSGEPQEVVLQTKAVQVSQTKGKSKAMANKMLARKNGIDRLLADEEDDEDEDDSSGKGKGGKFKKKNAHGVSDDIIDIARHLDAAEDLKGISKALTGTPLGKQFDDMLRIAEAAKTKAVTYILSTKSGKAFTADALKAMDYSVIDTLATQFAATDRMLAEATKSATHRNTTESGEPEEEDEDPEDDGLDPAQTTLSANSMDYIDYSRAGEVVRDRHRQPNGKPPRKTNYSGRAAVGSGGNSGSQFAPPPEDIFETAKK